MRFVKKGTEQSMVFLSFKDLERGVSSLQEIFRRIPGAETP